MPARTLGAAFFCLAALASPAAALTNDHGIVVFTHADALAGGVTPGDTPGYPVTISVPGSYRFGSTLTVTTEVNGIDVSAAEVTIDFAGFRLIGSGVGLHGIDSKQRALTVKNGTIRAFSDTAIISDGVGLVIDRMRLVQNGTGARALGQGARIVDSAIVSNVSATRCDDYCYVRGNTIIGNGNSQVILLGGASMMLSNLFSGDGAVGTEPVTNLADPSGWGDNAMNNFATPSFGLFLQMSPNSCTPSGC